MPGDPVAELLGAVLDAAHVGAVMADRAALGCPLSVEDARVLVRHCDGYADPNLAAEALIATGYRGCRVARAAPQPKPRRPRADAADHPPPGQIVRALEPVAYAIACDLAGWAWKAEWKAASFPDAIAARARQLAHGQHVARRE